jgi:hypothetical protein
MTRYTDEPLIAREVSIRRTEQEKLKITQQKKMNNRRITAPTNDFHQSVAASTDDYMKNALTQVRKSDVTLPDELTMRNGTFIYTNK